MENVIRRTCPLPLIFVTDMDRTLLLGYTVVNRRRLWVQNNLEWSFRLSIAKDGNITRGQSVN